MEKLTNKTLIQALSSKKILMVMLFLMVFMSVSSVSAINWDNVKTYDVENREATITNMFGYGKEIATARLDTEQIVYVIPGENRKVAEITINNFEEYSKAIGYTKFYNIKNDMKQTYREFVYKYKSGEDWIEFEEDVLPDGEITIGLFTTVYNNDYIEWIPTLFGIEIEEWASWTSSLNTKMQFYYTFEEAAGNLTDVFNGTYNGSVHGTPTRQEPGIIDFSYFFDGVDDGVNVTSVSPLQSNISTLSGWFNVTDATPLENAMIFEWGGDSHQVILLVSGELSMRMKDSANIEMKYDNTVVTESVWNHFVMTSNGSSVAFYINGTWLGNATGVGLRKEAGQIEIGHKGVVAENFEGHLDEFGMWNRSLTDAEVKQLYNDGAGISFQGGIAVTTTLNSPADNAITTNTSHIFNISATPTSSNLTNTTFYLWNSDLSIANITTNALTGNETNTTTWNITDIPFGVLEWNAFSCVVNSSGGDTVCNFADANRTITRTAFNILEDFYIRNMSETDSHIFRLNISTIPSILSVNANLNYNGTSHIASGNCDSTGFCNISKRIDIPLVQGSNLAQNKSYFWEVNVFDGTSTLNQNTTSNQQNVSKIFLSECNTTWDVQVVNFTAFEERNLTSKIDPFFFAGTFESWLGLGSVKKTSSFLNQSTPEFDMCITPPERNFTVDATIEYNNEQNSSTYRTRNYYFQNDTLTNKSNNLSLYLLQTNFATSFILKVQDTNILPLENHLIFTEKFDPGTGEFFIVQVAKTDDNGQSVGFFETEIIDYRFLIRFQQELLLETPRRKIVPESAPFTLTFTIGEDTGKPWEVYEGLENLQATLFFNKTSNITTFTYEDTSGEFELATLIVELQNYSTSGLEICNFNSTQTSATINCPVGNSTGTYVARAFIERDGEEFLVKLINFMIERAIQILGNLGLLMGWFIILVSSFTFKFNELAGIFMVNAAVIFTNLIGLISFGPLFIFGLIAVSIIIAVLINK